MKLYPFFSLILVSLFVISCNSDETGDVQLPDDDTISFYALEIGNTWNYQYYSRYRPDEDFIPMDYFEENKIVGDTMINGETFFELRATLTGEDSVYSIELEDGESRFLRDSLGYLIDQDGYIYFSTENPNEEYFIRAVSSSLDLYGMALPGLQNISVPAGEFDCSAEVIYVRYNESGELLPSMSEQFYKEGIGEILTEYSVITDSYHRYEKRLLNYELGN